MSARGYSMTFCPLSRQLEQRTFRSRSQQALAFGLWRAAIAWATCSSPFSHPLNAIGLLRVARNLGAHWDAGGSGLPALLDEVRWGNRYFLKMQDSDGLVWADVAGGVNGDNSDNHWTDNRPGTDDDRYLNPAKRGRNQALFVTVQAMAAQAFQASDAPYARQCLAAAQRCWSAAKREGN